jgi:hypothetical protein
MLPSGELAADRDLALPQVKVAAPRVARIVADPGQLPARIPVALSTAMTAASRRWAKLRPWQVFSRANRSPLG